MSQNIGLKWTPLLVGVLVPACVLGTSCAGPSRSTQESRHSGGSSSRMVTKLISAGQEPKSALRFKVAKGDKQYVTLTTAFERRMSFSLGFPLSEQGHVLQKLTLLATVTDVAASGDVSFEVSIVKAEMIPKKDGDPQIEQRMEQIADSFVGLGANFVVSSRGMLKSYTNIVKDGLDPLVKQAIQGTDDALPSIVIPFPEDPIGVGAKWSVTRQFTLRGVDMTRVGVYELTKFENGVGTVKVTVEENGRPGDVEVEGRPDAKQRVIKMTATSTGTHVFSLTEVLPKTGVLSSATEADMEVEFAPGEKQVMHLEMKATGKTTETTAPVNPVTSGQTTSRSGAITSGCNLPSPNRDFVTVSTSGSHVLGLRKDGVIVAFQGWNRYGECYVPEPNRDFVAIATGNLVSFGLKKDGSIVAWGCSTGSFGQLKVPEPNRDVVTISSGDFHSLALKKDGSIVAWGDNGAGQCEVPEPNCDFVAVSAGSSATGGSHSLGLKKDGSIVAWGDNKVGQCNVPEPNRDFVAISASVGFSLGLKKDGTVIPWGENKWGECTVPEPNSDFVAVSAGLGHCLGLKKDGSVVGWGRIDFYYDPTKVPDPNRDFVAVATGFRTSYGVKKDGSIVAWGYCPPPFPRER